MAPWFVKISAKILLSRLPLKYSFWRSLYLFRAGAMDDPSYAFKVFRMHWQRAGFADRSGYTVLELGPGDSGLTALFAPAHGAAATILVDSHNNATDDVKVLESGAVLLRAQNLPVPDTAGAGTIPEALARLNARYMTQGLQSLKQLPDASVDLIFSQAVMEHVRHGDFAATLAQMYRILKPDGVASHWIDFRDHLQDGLNNLRFSHPVWESDFMVRSGFYTNRIPWPVMERMILAAGFRIEMVDSVHWPQGLPTPQTAMASPYREMAPAELGVMTNWVLLRKV